MDILNRRFLFITGKGGVGKTTVATALALAASNRGKRVLLALINCKERVSGLLHTDPIGSDIVTLGKNFDAVNIVPSAALEEYGRMIIKVPAIYNAVFRNKLVRAFFKGTPGLEAWSMLGKAFFHASPPNGEPDYDLVIVDAPATGHALDMLRVPVVIEQVAPPGLLKREAKRALQLLQDPEQAGAVLVTLAEDMPVNETIELATALQYELQMPVQHLIFNRVLPNLFNEQEHEMLKALLPKELNQDKEISSLLLAGQRRTFREILQSKAIQRLRTHIGVEYTVLRHYFDLNHDTEVLHALSAELAKGTCPLATII